MTRDLQVKPSHHAAHNNSMIAKIALNIPYSQPFDYLVPDNIAKIRLGQRVIVPFGPRKMTGVVVDLVTESEFEKLKSLQAVVEDYPVYEERMLSLTKWISVYYVCSWGEVLAAALPTGIKPRITKQLVVQIDHEFIEKLNIEDKKWLLSLNGQKESILQKNEEYKSKRQLINKAKKYGAIEFQHETKNSSNQRPFEDWLSLEPKIAEQLKTRKGSRSERILEYLERVGKSKRKDLLAELPTVGTALNELRKKGAVIQEKIDLPVGGFAVKPKLDRFIILNDEQQIAVDNITAAIRQKKYRTFLLEGVTGSGKTEVYLYAVKETLEQGGSALILIPEISLTPQAVQRFRDRFGDSIAVLHSGLSPKERANEWWKIKNQHSRIVIGARSAIFAPLEQIDLIVIDEEHDSSYKQQETPYYNARDVAVKIAHDLDAIVILGTATPALESRNNANTNKYELIQLKRRVKEIPLPTTEIVNLKTEPRYPGVFYLSKYLVEQLKRNLENKKQALVFLNRRGFAAFLSCKSCDLPVLCENCSIALTWHKTQQKLFCHHCGYSKRYPEQCPSCNAQKFRMEGIGTQRVERDLRSLFPDARFLRMDRDSIRGKGSLEKNIDLINNQEVDFVIGTQLISKGHDFKHIGVVCVVMADMSLNIPDFRSSERTYQLISQVSGRAGRDENNKGLALIQSYNPDHYAVRSAHQHDFDGFFQQEMLNRELLGNPPFNRLILLRISDHKSASAEVSAKQLGAAIEKRLESTGCQILGPVESPIHKINNRYYWQILLKGKSVHQLKGDLFRLLWNRKDWKPVGSTRVSVDVDPYVLV